MHAQQLACDGLGGLAREKRGRHPFFAPRTREIPPVKGSLTLCCASCDFLLAEKARAVKLGYACRGLDARRNPVGRTKIDGLGDVEARIEAAVVGAGEGKDELTRVLDAAIHGDARSLQLRRVNQSRELKQ